MIRENCEICSSKALVPFYTLKNMPCRLGVSSSIHSYEFNDLIYAECVVCKNVQILDLPSREKVYESNHNINIVGETWQRHHREFAEYIANFLKQPSNVLEIGDPEEKTAKWFEEETNLISWDILEPMPSGLPKSKKVSYKKGFLDGGTDFETNYHIVVLSHVFEHILDLKSTIQNIYKVLLPGGIVAISVPNMEEILKKRSLPPASLSFEHTVYLDENKITALFEREGLELTNVKYYRDHSIFISFSKKSATTSANTIRNQPLKERMLAIFKEKEENVKRYVDYIETHFDAQIFIYGAHIQAQIFQVLGLSNNIYGTLDNSKDKQGNYLYGTELMTYPVEIIATLEKPIVICDMGVYNAEIKEQLVSLNKKVVIL